MRNLFLGFFFILILFLGFLFWPLPLAKETPKWTFYDKNGDILYSENLFSKTNKWENKLLEQSIIAVEDKNFYHHIGVDFLGISRAFLQNLKSKKIVSGASTITMQLARLIFLENEKHNFWYKIRQILYAIRLELYKNKSEILHEYLERVNFGNGAVGVFSGAQKYFSKTPENLSVGEIATLIAIIPNPSHFNPINFVEKSKKRRNLVLDILATEKIISSQEANFWKSQEIELNPQISGKITAPHFVFWARENIERAFLEKNIPFPKKEINVYTSLDKSLYESTLHLTREILERNAQNIHSAAIVILDSENQLRTMVGSPNFFNKSIDGAVNLAISSRQSGSVLKPFLYALALEKGFSPLDILRDEKKIFPSGYFPRNFNIEEENGRVFFRESLANSYNIAAVDLLNRIGISAFYKFCESFGLNFLNSAQEMGLSLILGSGETDLLSLTRAYSVFPNHGILKPIKFFVRVTDENGKILIESSETASKNNLQIIHFDTAEWITHVLSDNSARWKNFSRGNALELNFSAAAKTGTSQEFRDNWVVGFSPNFTVGVWAGNANGAPMFASSGLQGAGPIWQGVMRILHPNSTKTDKFQYSGRRKEVSVCTRPDVSNCAERFVEFLLPEEKRQIIEKEVDDFEIFYPREGDIFLKGTDLLVQVRHQTNENLEYILDGKPANSPIFKDLNIGIYQLTVLDKRSKKQKSVEFTVR